ncbi:MAG: CRISPR-associated protein Csx3 [Desulfohalobiaceae bacterium]
MEEDICIDVQKLYASSGQAKLSQIQEYEEKCQQMAGQGTDVILTGAGPIWLYLRLAHVLHGKVRSLWYESPVTGRVEIFNHNPY